MSLSEAESSISPSFSGFPVDFSELLSDGTHSNTFSFHPRGGELPVLKACKCELENKIFCPHNGF